jgi:hypothetical protein
VCNESGALFFGVLLQARSTKRYKPGKAKKEKGKREKKEKASARPI